MLEIVATVTVLVSGLWVVMALNARNKETARLFLGIAIWLMPVAIFTLLHSIGEAL